MNYTKLAYWAMIVFIFALGIYLFIYIRNESFQCISNPYTYSMKLLEKANNATVTCMCTAYRPGSPYTVVLTKDGFSKREATIYVEG